MTNKYTELAKTIKADEKGIKEYKQTKYTCKNGNWHICPEFDLVVEYRTEEELLQHIDEWDELFEDIPREKRVSYLDDETTKFVVKRLKDKLCKKI